ncbi:hypothetical protein M427DRAFT_133016 [Gonapodya prolifera JEL478]|uniref:Peptidase M60 domain-containing protein n=1 Tax=Gonapodya prolifera (strain JEL478) TaxID=1344416 RepID=A0A139ANQ9_GONPJ|nr:hypothetical protein M427DRAFT_133016 [Gonapodya prolifera JEL478]|eukprot:KXS18284.1 hypothetical protein M427DRAFT_133016 [Gonapodya prolifera JEL478]
MARDDIEQQTMEEASNAYLTQPTAETHPSKSAHTSLRQRWAHTSAKLKIAVIASCGTSSTTSQYTTATLTSNSATWTTTTTRTTAALVASSSTTSATTSASPSPSATPDPFASAMQGGSPGTISASFIVAAAQSAVSDQQTEYRSMKQTMFSTGVTLQRRGLNTLDNITWNPSQDSCWLTTLDTMKNKPILVANWSYSTGAVDRSGAPLAFAGVSDYKSRYAAFGNNPLGVRGNANMDAFMVNVIKWLTGKSDLTSQRVVVAHLPGSETYWFPHESATRTWLVSKLPNVTINNVTLNTGSQADNRCDGALLDACLGAGKVDLLILGREQGPTAYNGSLVMNAVLAAQARGIPLLYLHHYRDANDLASRVLDYLSLSVTINYWNKYGLNAFDPDIGLPFSPNALDVVSTLLTRLETGNFSSNWSGCAVNVARNFCSADATFMAEFGNPAANIRNAIRALDQSNTAIFRNSSRYRMERMLILLGDKYRENITYPLSKTANATAWYRAYFADHVAYIHRDNTTLALSLGTFAPTIPVTVPTISRLVSVDTPLTGTKDYMTGLYVIPGRTMVITRVDNTTATVTFGLNMVRDTTWVFQEPQGLDRPYLVSSPLSKLTVNNTIRITSPHGGTLILHVDAPSGATQTVSVQVDGVITHPVLRSVTNATEIAAFEAELKSTPTNWVGINMDTLILHSRLNHFNQSMKNYGNVTWLGQLTWQYTIKATYELAGFNSASGQLSLSPEVVNFCASRSWDCVGSQHRRDVVQHVISDSRAINGAGTSGNPFDENWPFDPIGWGETHEIGHNLQVGRHKIYDDRSTEVSNNLFPTSVYIRWNRSPEGQAAKKTRSVGIGQTAFGYLQAALNTSDPFNAVYTNVWANPAYAAQNSQRLMFYRQLIEHARHYGTGLGDGWGFVTLSYLQERNVAAASSTWNVTTAIPLGFSLYNTSYPSSISGNDFMVISTSFIIGVDMRPMFDTWGVSYTAAASAQVASFSLNPVPKVFFPMRDIISPVDKVGAPLTINSTTIYSEPS